MAVAAVEDPGIAAACAEEGDGKSPADETGGGVVEDRSKAGGETTGGVADDANMTDDDDRAVGVSAIAAALWGDTASAGAGSASAPAGSAA
jgi:hypothetical protein